LEESKKKQEDGVGDTYNKQAIDTVGLDFIGGEF
jgi:hypothetical protein